MAERKKLGDLLKEAGLIDDFQLQSALSHQRNWGGKLGAVLVELEFVREEDMSRVISEKMHVPYMHLFDPVLPPETTKLLKVEHARKYGVMPVKKESNSLVLAMSDPTDIGVMDEIRFITGLAIKPVLAMESEIKDAIRKYYDGEMVDRGKKSVREAARKSSQMEIVREMPDISAATHQQKGAERSEVETIRQDLNTQKMIIEAMAALLIEKDLISRDELARMIEQKKMGL